VFTRAMERITVYSFSTTLCYLGSQDGAVAVGTTTPAGVGNFSRKRPDRLWALHSFLFSWFSGFLSRE
jgi:hypothetical protein